MAIPAEIKHYAPKKVLTVDAFVDEFPHPFLVVTHTPLRSGQGGGLDTICGDSISDLTVTLPVPQRETEREKQLVYMVAKGGNGFGFEVYGGRTPNNDIHLLGGDVSKVHFALKPALRDSNDLRRDLVLNPTDTEKKTNARIIYLAGDGDVWQIRDNESTNGTHLNGIRLEGKSFSPIKSGDTLKIAGYTLKFLLPEDFHKYLNER